MRLRLVYCLWGVQISEGAPLTLFSLNICTMFFLKIESHFEEVVQIFEQKEIESALKMSRGVRRLADASSRVVLQEDMHASLQVDSRGSLESHELNIP